MSIFIIGTSKSKPVEEGYYIRNQRFWDIINEELSLEQEVSHDNYHCLEQQCDIIFTELVHPHIRIINGDRNIALSDLRKGKKYLDRQISEHEPEILAFVGKTAFTWFALTHLNDMQDELKIKNINYGEVYYYKNKIKCYLLTNTHNHFDETIWREFWKFIKGKYC